MKALLMSSNYTYQPAEIVLSAILLIAAYVDIIGVNDALLKRVQRILGLRMII